MEVLEEMITYEGRVATFNALASGKRRTSTTRGKGQKPAAWPHTNPTPHELAKAGFFYSPVPSSADNVVCFLCHTALDGWETEDVALAEHLHHSPDCAWAIAIAIEQKLDIFDWENENPQGERLMQARRATFGGKWPHETKKGWTCKTEKMVESGWYYCPTSDSDDFVSCAYCGLSLDGWEPKDKPMDEHRRRSPGCNFFVLLERFPSKPAGKGGRKGRLSKTTRLSTQSTIEPNTSVIEPSQLDGDESVMTVATTTSTKGAKKSKARNPRPSGTGKSTRGRKAKWDQEDPSTLEASVDDSIMQVDHIELLQQPARGRKRPSSAIDNNDESRAFGKDSKETVEIVVEPPAKRRSTRASSVASNSRRQYYGEEDDPSNEIDTQRGKDSEKSSMGKSRSNSKVGRKGRKASNKGSADTRKVSTASTASKASLRMAIPDDEEIDRALEEELDRPLTDDEPEVAKSPEVRLLKGRNRGPSRASPSQPAASVASVRKVSRQQRVTNESQMNSDQVDTEKTIDDSEKTTKKKKGPAGKQAKNKKVFSREETNIHVSVNDSNDSTMAQDSHQLQLPDLKQSPAPKETETTKRSKADKKPAEDAPKPRPRPAKAEELEQDVVVSVLGAGSPASAGVKESKQTPKTGQQVKMKKNATSTKAQAIQDLPAATQAAKPEFNTPSPSPQSSDAENQPPSSRPAIQSASQPSLPKARSPLKTTSTNFEPISTPTKTVSRLKSTLPWTAADMENALFNSPRSKLLSGHYNANTAWLDDAINGARGNLTSPEKGMTVEQWIHFNAQVSETRLKTECERMVGKFEFEGNRALQALEGLEVLE